MILELGRAMRMPGSPAVNSKEPMDEACEKRGNKDRERRMGGEEMTGVLCMHCLANCPVLLLSLHPSLPPHLAHAYGGHGRADVLHCVVDRQPCRHDAPG